MQSSAGRSTGPIDSAARRTGRAGRASSIGLLLVLALVGAGLALGAWLALGGESDAGRDAVAPRESHAAPAEAPASAGPSDRAPSTSSGARAGSALASPLAGARPGETGTIRGTIHPPQGAPLPDVWTAVVERSELYDAGPVPTRRVEVRGGRAEFTLRDLPLGGYAVRAETAEWNSSPVHVLLVPGSTTQIVSLPLSPTGFVDGSVLDADGRPAEGVELVLERRSDGLRIETRTLPDGTFVLREVHDGEHRLFVGSPATPLVPPRELSFAAPSLRVPPIELPATTSILFWTIDREGVPVADVALSGFGRSGGQLHATSDGRGRAEVRWLLPGSWRISGEAPDGRTGRADVELAPGEQRVLELRVLTR